MGETIGFLCPIFEQECLQEKCVGYTVHTKEAFKDKSLNRYIPIDDLPFYRTLSSEVLETRFDRIVSITRECRLLSTLIEKEEVIDHLVPNQTEDYYI